MAWKQHELQKQFSVFSEAERKRKRVVLVRISSLEKRGGTPALRGSVPLHRDSESRLVPIAGAMASGHYYCRGSPTSPFPATQRAPLVSQQPLPLRRQQTRGLQQQPLPPLESEKNVITLYSNVITATIQRCAQLQNAKVLDAIERHWRIALQRRTTELRRSSNSSAAVSTSGSIKSERQHESGAYSSQTSSSSGNSISGAAATGRRVPEKQETSRPSGVTTNEVETCRRDNRTDHPAADAAKGKQELRACPKVKTENGAAATTEISSCLKKTFDARVKPEQSSPADVYPEPPAEAARGGDAVPGSSNATTGHRMREVKEEEENDDNDDDEFADADVDEAKPAVGSTESVADTQDEGASGGRTGSADGAQAKAEGSSKAEAADSRDANMQRKDPGQSAKAVTESAEAKSSNPGSVSHRSVEPLDIERPESLDDVSDIEDQEPSTTDGIFALYEKVRKRESAQIK